MHTYAQNGTKRYMDIIASRCNDRFGSSRFSILPVRPLGSLHSSICPYKLQRPYIQLSSFCMFPSGIKHLAFLHSSFEHQSLISSRLPSSLYGSSALVHPLLSFYLRQSTSIILSFLGSLDCCSSRFSPFPVIPYRAFPRSL